jgi:hypothetical protein
MNDFLYLCSKGLLVAAIPTIGTFLFVLRVIRKHKKQDVYSENSSLIRIQERMKEDVDAFATALAGHVSNIHPEEDGPHTTHRRGRKAARRLN